MTAASSPQPRTLPQTAADTSSEQPWPVRLLTMKISDYVARMPWVWVEGQIVELKRRPGSTTAFLTLRDPDVDMSLPVTCHIRVLSGLPDGGRHGMRVVVRAKPEFWPKRGSLQLSAVEIRPVGVGELLARIEHLKRVLAAEGLFDEARKKDLPFLPRAIGLVCGRASAAERDVVVTARHRWPGVRFVVREVVVQGAGAVEAVSASVAELDGVAEVDVIVVARGGGSLEDLLPFSNETLLRAVAQCRTPVVSAIGHEVDSPLLDLVADVRASTPTDAGRRVVPAVHDELAGLGGMLSRLRRSVRARLDAEDARLEVLAARPVLAEPRVVVEQHAAAADDLRQRARRALRERLDRAGGETRYLRGTVQALSPASTLQRGYAVVQTAEGTVVRAAEQVDVADALRVRLAQGELAAQVTAVSVRGPRNGAS
ncbi:MAG: exodeoxyribonuclease VII large subunit [Actinomycetes bacterium]